ncbi:MAG: hypothetical protein ACI8Q1_001064 [Parvicella sp.]|jgi:hypothetical protein
MMNSGSSNSTIRAFDLQFLHIINLSSAKKTANNILNRTNTFSVFST